MITLVRLAVLRDSSACTDRIRLRDILDGPLPSPGARVGGVDGVVGVGECGRIQGVPALQC
ncbi:hypothetical protein [Streptomyces ossamyceticus]|uniref:hypothetical protein n=1 Tax=Streptomyces ossamyceticus TaxID=249581 RepID=UPI0006E2B977|nr:hypothetical protein [Streptomyces ossamyceticus]